MSCECQFGIHELNWPLKTYTKKFKPTINIWFHSTEFRPLPALTYNQTAELYGWFLFDKEGHETN